MCLSVTFIKNLRTTEYMKNLIFILTAVLLTACSTEKPEEGKIMSVPEVDSCAQETSLDYSNPAYMAGSDFGHMFQEFYKVQDYESMLAFTSSESIELHGEDVLLKHYEEMEFGFDLGTLESANENEDGVTTLFYLSELDATKMRTMFSLKDENDSCKVIIYQDIENFPRKLNK